MFSRSLLSRSLSQHRWKIYYSCSAEKDRSFQLSRIPLKEVLLAYNSLIQSEITVFGWVTACRTMKDYSFINIKDGSSYHHLQLIAPTSSLPQLRNLTFGSSLVASGLLVRSTHPGQELELQVSACEILGTCNGNEYPFKSRKRHSSDYLRTFPHLRGRYYSFASLLRIRQAATMAIHKFFQSKGYLFCHTPILSSSDCEATGEQFVVQSPYEGAEDFFGEKAFLTASGQLHAESLASCMTSVYTFGPTFRAEKSHTRKHLSEFYMVEAETVCLGGTREGLASLMELIEDLVKSVVLSVLEENPLDMQTYYDSDKKNENRQYKYIDPNKLSEPFPRLTYTEAVKLLQESPMKFTQEIKWGEDLHSEHERYLVNHHGELPLFVTDFPAAMRPFYAKINDSNIESSRQTVASVDLLVPGPGELVGCSMREENYDILKDRLDREGKAQQYQWYLDLRRFGTVPHGGFGLGFERFLQAMLGVDNIKDVIPFPRWAGSCRI